MAFGEGAFGEFAYGESPFSATAPVVTLKALLHFDGNVDDGRLVRVVAVAWLPIIRMFVRDPPSIYDIDWRQLEEIIAGAYTEAGFDKVILTPASGDGGRDVIAIKSGVGSICFYDQVKRYKPGHLVTAEEVRAMLGVITGRQNVSKGIISTTSGFAPRLEDDPAIAPYIPHRIELRPGNVLLSWLAELAIGKM